MSNYFKYILAGEKREFYGKQRQWGALGWGISSFFVGSLVSTVKEQSHCNVPEHIDYKLSFYAFAIIMLLTFIPASYIQFDQRNSEATTLARQLQTMATFESLVFLITIQQFGNSWGILQTFLFWHLQDLGGTQFLFSVIAAIQCLSEVISYQTASFAILKLGHNRVLYIGLLYSTTRFILYGVTTNPWLVIPIELFHGVSTTLTWAIAVSYIGINTGISNTTQGILSGIYWGLGVGGGAIFGGIIIHAIGSRYTFFAYGILNFINFIGFVLTQNLKRCVQAVQPVEERQSLLTSFYNEEMEMESTFNSE